MSEDNFHVSDYPLPEDGVTYCCYCVNLSSAELIRFQCPSIKDWDTTKEGREISHQVRPGYSSVIQMDLILRYLQARDPQAYMIFNHSRLNSVRACMVVDGYAVCIYHAGELIHLDRQGRPSRNIR